MKRNCRKRCQARSILKWKGGKQEEEEEKGGGLYCADDSVSSLARVKAPVFFHCCSTPFSPPSLFFTSHFSFSLLLPRFPPFRCRWLALRTSCTIRVLPFRCCIRVSLHLFFDIRERERETSKQMGRRFLILHGGIRDRPTERHKLRDEFRASGTSDRTVVLVFVILVVASRFDPPSWILPRRKS